MNLRQVETFYWAAHLGGFARAANHLNATPSAVSMRIQELEADLGIKLFDRGPRAVSLTAEGRRLLPLAERLVDAAADIAELSQGRCQPAGLVRLGVAEAIAVTWLPAFLARLRATYPDVFVEVQVALSYILEQELERGGLDAVMAPSNLSCQDFRMVSLGAIEFRWMYSPKLRDVPATMDAADLGQFPLITTSRDSGFRGATADWLRRNQVRLLRPTICNTFSIAARLCTAGQGLALLPVSAYADEVSKGSLRILSCEPQPDSLEHFLLRPTGRDEITMSAIERLALDTTTFTPDKPQES